MKKFVVDILKLLAKQTDNKLDDAAVQHIEILLYQNSVGLTD